MANLDVEWDDERGAVLLRQSGIVTADDMRGLAVRVASLLERSRERNGNALMLVDARDMPDETIAALARARGGPASTSLFRTDDRVALLVSSSLVKSQLSKIGSSILTYGFFLSRQAAETWLFAHRQRLSA